MHFLLRLFVRYASLGSPERLRRIARRWSFFLCCIVRFRRRVVLDALRRSFPEWSGAECRKTYRGMMRHQVLDTLELFRFAGPKRGEFASRIRLDPAIRSCVEGILAEGRGLLILIAHIGAYDLFGMLASELFGFPIHIIAKPIRNPGVHRFWNEVREGAGVHVIASHQAYRPALKALKGGGIVGFMLDQNRPAGQGVFVPFFGRPASTTPGLALLSYHSKAPVLPAFLVRGADGTHTVVAGEAIAPPAAHDEATLKDYTARYTAVIEEMVRRDPSQWLWLHKRWKSRPPEESAAGK
jgi:KDO2-lipid IV(A) lauroyltransferase